MCPILLRSHLKVETSDTNFPLEMGLTIKKLHMQPVLVIGTIVPKVQSDTYFIRKYLGTRWAPFWIGICRIYMYFINEINV
jgi:hypothetical protein